MSMQSGLGAAGAASEILKLIEKLEDKADYDLEEFLDTIKAKCKEIKETGESGWY